MHWRTFQFQVEDINFQKRRPCIYAKTGLSTDDPGARGLRGYSNRSLNLHWIVILRCESQHSGFIVNKSVHDSSKNWHPII